MDSNIDTIEHYGGGHGGGGHGGGGHGGGGHGHGGGGRGGGGGNWRGWYGGYGPGGWPYPYYYYPYYSDPVYPQVVVVNGDTKTDNSSASDDVLPPKDGTPKMKGNKKTDEDKEKKENFIIFTPNILKKDHMTLWILMGVLILVLIVVFLIMALRKK